MFPHAAACRRSASFVLAAGQLPSSGILHSAMVGGLSSGILHSAMVGALQRRAEANSKHIFKPMYRSIYRKSRTRREAITEINRSTHRPINRSISRYYSLE